MQPQNSAYSSSGQDSRFSFLQQGFDSPIGYEIQQLISDLKRLEIFICKKRLSVSFSGINLLSVCFYQTFVKKNRSHFEVLILKIAQKRTEVFY